MTHSADIHAMPGHLIRRLNQISTSVFHDHMRQAGVDLTPVQFAALSVLRHEPGLDQATLATRIAYDRATLGGVVDRLEQKALISRQVSATDRRARVLAVTAAGVALLDQVTPIVTALQSDILSGLTPAERATFITLARKVTQDRP